MYTFHLTKAAGHLTSNCIVAGTESTVLWQDGGILYSSSIVSVTIPEMRKVCVTIPHNLRLGALATGIKKEYAIGLVQASIVAAYNLQRRVCEV